MSLVVVSCATLYPEVPYCTVLSRITTGTNTLPMGFEAPCAMQVCRYEHTATHPHTRALIYLPPVCPCSPSFPTQLLSYSAGRGPLSYPGLSAPQWLLMLALPYFPAKSEYGRRQAVHVRCLPRAICTVVVLTVWRSGTVTAVHLFPVGSLGTLPACHAAV